ncbi:M20/M25/M40 family metallo-hydrolase [Reichenbachiella carrageenanivorans]|uniref:Carboxypeptidase Q n=1 Tax=Reichenbachiella carrageenanivorans TaxID=2979869 RepID=A0ABY6D5H6_9BACT|nr:M20/M25/M40 family metallo-hydrolase [Reichenbachiella carrageenanivorans]UXX80373.1 M20/M25/M40 family metallo-hydrolase [Reichenbachiella carrageenanivorans]
MKKCLLAAVLLLIALVSTQAQDHEKNLRTIFDEALTNGQSYPMLEYLSLNIGHRLSGSPSAAAAVEYTRQQMEALGFDKVYLQEVMVPHWVRGQKEIGRIVNAKTFGSQDMNVIALGNSVGTGPSGLLAEVIELQSLEELEKLGKKNIEGKIVFFNRPMDAKHINTGHAYGGAGDQRVVGPSAAAKYGAVGVVVRSLTLALDDVPHTGTLIYEDGVTQIPAVAISTIGANYLSKTLKTNKGLQFYMETHCEMLPDVLSYNVIGELTGTTLPNEYIVVAGHLDSWDVGDGSHDDGAGCVQAIEAVRIFKATGIRPKRTIRAVMYMNEENGLRGGLEYARVAKEKGEKHLAALESDAGGFTPRGFGIKSTDAVLTKMQSWVPLLAPYELRKMVKGYGGADINPLEDQGTVLIGLMPDSQRYFDYHHTAEDTFDKVNKRELELGAASMAALIYLIDQEGF